VQSCSPSRRSSSSRNPMMLCCPCLRPSPNIPSSPSPASSNRLQQQRPLCPCCPPPPSPLSCTLWRGGGWRTQSVRHRGATRRRVREIFGAVGRR
jgi:hypothetical protein